MTEMPPATASPEPNSGRNFRIWVGIAGGLLVLILLGLATQGRGTSNPQILPPPTLGSYTADDALRQASEATARANLSLDTIDRILGILQVMGVVIAVATAVIAFAGYRTSREFSEEMTKIRDLQGDIQKALEEADQVRDLLGKVENAQQRTERLRSEVSTNLAAITGFRDELASNLREVDEHINNAYKAGALSQLGQRQIALGNISAAAKTFRDVCVLDPENPIYQYFLGDLLIRQDRVEEGLHYLNLARQDSYKYPSADASYAYALRLRGDGESDPIKREGLYYESGKIFLGVYEIDRGLIDISGESVFGALAGLYRRQGRYNDALQWYDHCRQTTPGNSYPVNNLAVLHFRLGNQTEAQRYFRQAVSLALEKLGSRSSDYWARFDLVTAKAALGDSRENLAMEWEKVRDVPKGSLKKFLYGVEDLRQTVNAAPGVIEGIDALIGWVKDEIKRRDEKGQ